MSEPIIRTFTIESWGTITSSTLPGNQVVNAIHECITRNNDGKGHYWSLDTDSLSETGIRIENSLITGIVLKNTYTDFDGNSKTQKLTLRSYGSTKLRIACAVHPDGISTIFDSLPTSNNLVKTAASFTGAQESFSGEAAITGGYYSVANSNDWTLRYYDLTSTRIADGQTITGWIIELPDAITIALKTTGASNNWLYSFHAGKIIIPNDLSDYSNYIDGSAILIGRAGLANNGYSNWMRFIDDTVPSFRNVSSSLIRVGQNEWQTPYVINSGQHLTATSNIDNSPRLVPYEVRAGNDSGTSSYFISGIIGTTKYLRRGPSGTLNDVIDSTNSSNNISWLRQYVSGANALMFHIWKRDVSPTTAQ